MWNFTLDLAHSGVFVAQWLSIGARKSGGQRFNSSWELRIFSLCHARGKTKKRLIILLLYSQTKLVETLHQSNVYEVLSLSPTFKCYWLPSSRPILRRAGRGGGYYMCQQMCLGLQIAWRILLFFWFSCFRPVFVFVYLFANSAKERDHSCPVNANIYFGLVIGHYLSLGEGRELEDFGCVAIKWPDPLIRLCSIVMIPPHCQVISSQFLSPPSLHTLLATTGPLPFPFQTMWLP